MKTTLFTTRLSLCWVPLVSALLWGCGGAVNVAGGVGSGGSGVAEGTISGFGSVVVDGVTFEDTDANVVRDTAQGVPELTQAKLGQRVRVMHSKAGVAESIVVMPQLLGTASSAVDNAGWFQLLGQWVRIVDTTDTQSTATYLDGFSSGLSVKAGDALEVHGTWVFDSSKDTSVLVATRIEKLSAAPDPVLVSGVVRARSGNVLTLDGVHNGLSIEWTNGLPTRITTQNLVSAWVAASETSRVLASATTPTSPWRATRGTDASPQITGNTSLSLGAQISASDLSKGTVMVQGLPVKLPADWRSSANTNISVQMDIVRDGEGWKAVKVKERESDSDLGGAVSLKGVLTWPAVNPSVLKLRDVTVGVTAVSLASSCQSLRTGDSVYVEVTARRGGPLTQPLQTTQVLCDLQKPLNSVIEVSGRISRISPSSNSAGTLVLSSEKGLSQTFQWNALTLLPKGFSASALGQEVEVEYQVVNGENRLRRIKFD